MKKPKIVVDNNPSISVTGDSFITSFKKSDMSFTIKTIAGAKGGVGNYYLAINFKQIDELVEFLRTVKAELSNRLTPPKGPSDES